MVPLWSVSGGNVQVPSQPSPNFAYLAHHDARLVALATQAEEVFASDPPTSIAKLRLFAEVLAKRAPAKVGRGSRQWLATGRLRDPTRPGSLPNEHTQAPFINAATRLAADERPQSVAGARPLLPSTSPVRLGIQPPQVRAPVVMPKATRLITSQNGTARGSTASSQSEGRRSRSSKDRRSSSTCTPRTEVDLLASQRCGLEPLRKHFADLVQRGTLDGAAEGGDEPG